MPDLFVDRDRERRALRDLLTIDGPTLALVYGRRRVGKTYLLTNSWPASRTFYFVAAESTGAVNRRELLAAIGRRFHLDLDPADFPTWRTVFRLLFGLASPKPLVVVLDEFQYLMGTGQGVPSHLSAVYDIHKDRRPFVVVLSGSAVRTMESLQAGDSPLYGRLAKTLRIKPFDYLDAAALMPCEGLKECATAYGIYGGTPRYLRSLRADRSLPENVAADVLSPGGQVRTQVETVIDQERGLRDTEEYKAILRAVGGGRTQLNDIAMYVGLPNGTPLRKKLGRLVALGYVAAGRNFDARPKAPFRYSLADPALRFHATLVERYRPELEKNDARDVWSAYIAREIDSYMGLVFERMVEQAYHRLRTRLKLPMIAEWSRWEGTDRTGASREVDIVARLTDGRMLTGAIKWGQLGLAVHQKHLRDLQALANSGHAWAREALRAKSPFLYATGRRFPANFRRRAEQDGHPVLAWTLEELYRGRRTPPAARRVRARRK
ncbi:MAG TPA: ATP-binding protein [Gemmatimonadaceae bacterium]|nr:ATP-binding protein [Gemmatimonadaceae bacterium]